MLPPGDEDNQGGGRISRDRLPPGGQPLHGWLAPRGLTCPGDNINWDTGGGMSGFQHIAMSSVQVKL